MPKILSLRTLLHCATLLCALPATANNLDPLSAAEIARATQRANAATPVSTIRSTTTNNANIPAPELLLVERHPNAKGQTARLADVYTYDYSTNETIIDVVDLDTNQVISSRREQKPATAADYQTNCNAPPPSSLPMTNNAAYWMPNSSALPGKP
jgi:Cu2+-containing amine oxidase